ncbi:V-snare-domain-containing protein [Rozella allomycis CSF55]|uniref:V-snare-domain-containing protein n=1 Tax=Rozella allomycis (strain CSF55) TaxID=988480 RepID=A0A075ATQ0_ROZAC|nr:hypothetical protein O9G_001942 [Rozella allomycis CSF55]RKP20115.1 V-snare-domain-containing protein [Rozella allomycis CSF55]|eukprot:EPZ31932.1 hypothetical protein O9G_001942 [Rozella allomycis CSF55]
MDLFETYEQDYTAISTNLSRKLKTTDLSNLTGDQRRSFLKGLEKDVRDAEGVVGKMQMEISGMVPSQKQKCQPKFKNYQMDFENLKKDYKIVANNLKEVGHRDELFQGGEKDLDSVSYDQRQKLLRGTERLEKNSKQLDHVINIANETQDIGASIMNNLRSQREQIENATRRVQDTDTSLDRSNRILKGMARRMKTNKAITALIILILVVTIVIVILSKLGLL